MTGVVLTAGASSANNSCLLNIALPFAQQMLDRRGEFLPYGIALSASGEARMVAGDPGQGERPRSHDVLSTIVDGLRSEREELRAVAAMAVLLPYTKRRLRRGVDVGELAAGVAVPTVWA